MTQHIQENFIAYMRLFSDIMLMRDDEHAFWFISGKPAPGNSILKFRQQGDDVEAQIDALFAEIGQHIDKIEWMVFPSDTPDDLGKRLDARGMPGGLAGNWLQTDLTKLVAAPAVSDDFHIKRVTDDAMLKEWVALSEAGFEEELSEFYPAYAQHGYGDDAFSLHFTGYLGDIPVTTGTLLDFGGTASIYDVSTPPQHRKQGFAGAMTHALMEMIRERGYNETWIWSSDIAKSLYHKLGYVDIDFGVREHVWKA